ncbi:MAG: CusA/CzcA family heavy metal efflux RND transporter [Lewinellaceae bacterium]|nr:CusA/CzcA family heavy metal efflux RND transporter [Lewinellaceae bacterium]
MIKAIISFAVRQKVIIGILVAGLIVAGIVAVRDLPLDAVPDITNNQVQVVTVSPSLAPQEVEQFITYPVEVAVANIPRVTEIRSISRFGLSVVTIVFADGVPILEARQFVKEQLGMAIDEIPAGMGTPELMPITTGLGEIYQYVLRVDPEYTDQYDAMELRTIQDWIVKRQLAGISGIIEVSSFGGYLKQYEVAIDPLRLRNLELTLEDVFTALARNNQNTGGSYIEKQTNAYYIRTEGLVESLEDIEKMVVANDHGVPVLIRDVGTVRLGSPKRFGAMTMDGQGEAVGGITLMFKGANSSEAIANVHQRIETVRKSLPPGITLYPYLDRGVLVGKTIHTVRNNLLEGGLIVIVVLILLLGNLRAGLIVASVIPLAMLFALILMRYFGVSANLMSLGAIDFGIVVDGAVIVVEGVLHTLFAYYAGKTLTQQEMDHVIVESSAKLFRTAVFGVFIILVVFVPIMTLTGIEGKMFRPMAMTFSFAILGALILSLTYVPAVAALGLSKRIQSKPSMADRIVGFLRNAYRPTLLGAMRRPWTVVGLALAVLVGTGLLFSRLGSEFIPTLEEGDLAMQMSIQPGSSLQESIRSSTKAEKILLANFPEVKHVVSKIGTAEVPTDPMAVEDADIMIILKEKGEWTSAQTREELVEKMKAKLDVIAGTSFEFTQPIQLRFNELMTGAKTDIAVKIFGEDTEELKRLADRAAAIITDIPGAGDVKVEQTEGLPQLMVRFNRQKIAEYGLDIETLNTVIRTAFAGESAGVVFENERKFDLVVRLGDAWRQEVDLGRLFVNTPQGVPVAMSELAEVVYTEGPMQISRENARRRINIGINVRNRDVASLVADIESNLQNRLPLPAGYSIQYGGQFENLVAARQRLLVAVPAALALIFVLLFFTFGRLKYALLIFSAVPLSAVGGVIALWLRGMPFSISAGVGFIALFGVAVLNGIVLISYFNLEKTEANDEDLRKVILQGSLVRLRPVIMTATVAAFGFLPMALSTSNGAEVQKPLATVVIGGLITATILTLVVLPVLYYLVERPRKSITPPPIVGVLLVIFFTLPLVGYSQGAEPALDSLLAKVRREHPLLQRADLSIAAAATGEQQARRVPATTFDLQLGQMNTNLFDFNLAITQGLGKIGADRQRRELARAQVALTAAERQRLEHQLLMTVRQAWYGYAYAAERRQLVADQLDLYREIQQRTDQQYQRGEIGGLEKSLTEARRLQVEQQLLGADAALAQARLDLYQAAWLPETASLPAVAGTLPLLPLPVDTARNSALLAPWIQQEMVSRQEMLVRQREIAPEWRVGYFNQSIRPDFPLQGVLLGVDVPLFKQYYQGRIQEAEVNYQIAQSDRQRVNEERLRRQTLAREQATRLAQQLARTQGVVTEQVQTLRRLATAQWQSGETDFFRYVQSLDAAFQSELEFLDLRWRYDETVLEWMYWKD